MSGLKQANETPALLELKSVSKRFGSVQVLNGIDLQVRPGEVLALLGDNGAGKSTLIKILAGVHQASEGDFLWEGKSVRMSGQNGPHQARSMGIETVYQHLGLVPTLSIARNFFLGREKYRHIGPFRALERKKMKQITAQHIKDSGISRALDPDDAVTCLSGGERQAIVISRAKYFGAKLLIMDEPTSALSLRQTDRVLQYVREASDSGIAVILITHNLDHVIGRVDRISVLFHGQKVGEFPGYEADKDVIRSLINTGKLPTTH